MKPRQKYVRDRLGRFASTSGNGPAPAAEGRVRSAVAGVRRNRRLAASIRAEPVGEREVPTRADELPEYRRTRIDNPPPERLAAREAARQQVVAQYPQLAELGDRLIVENLDEPRVQREVAHLAALPPTLLYSFAATGDRVVITGGNLVNIDEYRVLQNERPRGYPRGSTFANVGGVYSTVRGEAVSAAAPVGEFREAPGVAAHEVGHSIGYKRGWEHPNAIGEWHRRLIREQRPGMTPYLEQDGPGSEAGCQELIAESIADYSYSRARAVRLYGAEYVRWME